MRSAAHIFASRGALDAYSFSGKSCSCDLERNANRPSVYRQIGRCRAMCGIGTNTGTVQKNYGALGCYSFLLDRVIASAMAHVPAEQGCRLEADISATNLGVNEATWVVAESKSLWARLLARLCAATARGGRHHDKPGPGARAVVLVGTFPDAGHLSKATAAFDAAAFTTSDIVSISPSGADHGRGAWRWLFAFFRRSGNKHINVIRPTGPVQASVREVLASGGGLVFIHTASRFPQACEIILSSGGHIGVQASGPSVNTELRHGCRP